MATGHSFVEEVEKLLKKGKLYHNVDQFSRQIGYLHRTNQPLATDLVLRSSCLAKSKAEGATSRQGSRYFQDWSRSLAIHLDQCQLYDKFWIEQYVHELSPTRPRKEQVYSPVPLQKDIRSIDDPSFPNLTFVEGIKTPTKEEEHKLLSLSSQSDGSQMDIGSDPDIGLGSPIPNIEPNLPVESKKQAVPQRPEETTPYRTSLDPKRPATTRESRSRTRQTRQPPARAKATISPPHSPSTRSRSRVVKTQGSGIVSVSFEATPRSSSSRRVSSPKKRTLECLADAREVLNRRVKKQKRSTVCLVPNCKEEGLQYPKVHAFRHHLPGIFDIRLPRDNKDIFRSRVRALEQAVIWLAGRPGSIDELIPIINAQHLLDESGRVQMSEAQVSTMNAFHELLGIRSPVEFTLNPVNCVGALLHWRVLLVIVALLNNADDQDFWKKRFPVPAEFEGFPPTVNDEALQDVQPTYPAAVDSHFHLDRLSNYAHLRLDEISSILQSASSPDDTKINIVAAVANFCDPDSYPRLAQLSTLPQDLLVAVGLHPKHAYRSQAFLKSAFREMDRLLADPKVIAIGEFGLDHSVRDKEWAAQNEVVREMKKRIRPHHIVVIHCRSMRHDSGLEVNALLISLLHGLPKTQAVHVHAFMGTPLIAQLWIEEFPNVHFSFNRSVNGFNQNQLQALAGLDNHRILLETDAPYFPRVSTPFSSPCQLYDVAEMVARCRQVEPRDVLQLTTQNALRLYKGQ